MGNFRELIAWQKAKDLAVSIYKLVDNEQFKRDYSLKDQIRRAAVSVPANIAEGDELGSDKQSIRHFYIARGSSAELQTLLMISNEVGMINKTLKEDMISECRIISSMLSNLIKSRSGDA